MKTRDFRLFWLSEFLSQIAGVAAAFAVPLVLYRETGSLALTGTISTASAIAGLVFGLLGGSLGDMGDRKKIILASEVIGVASCLGIAAMLAGETVSIAALAGLLCVIAAVGAISMACTEPALPQLVSAEELPRAQGLMQARMQIGSLLGPMVGGLLLGFAPWAPFLAAAVGSMATIALLIPIRTSLNPATRATTSLWATTMQGFAITGRSAFLRWMIAHQILFNCAINGALFLAVIALEDAGYSTLVIGTARTAIGVIGIAGALCTGLIQSRFAMPTLQVLNGAWLVAMLAATGLLSDSVWLVIPLGATVIFAPAAGAMVYAAMSRIIPEEAFGRATTIQMQAIMGTSGLWTSPLSYLSGAFSLAAGFWISTGLALVGLGTVFPFNRVTAHALEEAEATETATPPPATQEPGSTQGRQST